MSPRPAAREALLLGSVFVVAAAGLVYELIAGTLSTYLLGSSVLVFSVVIGVFLSAMGLGAWLAQFVRTELVRAFVLAELALAFFGGLSALALFAAFSFTDAYVLAGFASCVMVGALVGVEIPLLLRILEQRVTVRVAVSHVLAVDYVGALVGSVVFPVLLLPHLGLVRAAALLGLLNVLVAVLALRLLGDEVPRGRRLLGLAAGVAVVLGAVLLLGGRATSLLEDRLYSDPVVLSDSTPYQRIVVTRWRDDTRLFLDGHLQFSSVDEHRYHEPLVHPAMAAATQRRDVLVLGGGDGMAVREVLRWPEVQTVTLVDLDPAVTELFVEHGALSALNGRSLSDPRVEVQHDDAVRFLHETTARFDVIVMDLPDPNDAQLARLYSEPTFRLARQRLREGGALVTQATSPFYAREAFWCVVRTMQAAFDDAGPGQRRVLAYHSFVPSFGSWGWALALPPGADAPSLAIPPRVNDQLRFLDADTLASLFVFPRDLEEPPDVPTNTLASAELAGLYLKGWRRWH